LSQEQLADAAGVHVTHLGGVERGVRNPNYATIVKLARALGVAPTSCPRGSPWAAFVLLGYPQCRREQQRHWST
jgi:transcriptional regulator with XRE-family HTH domain